MKLNYFHVDAFTSKVFFGNPAGVCPLDEWIDEGIMQLVAAENNHAETAFFVPCEDGYELRWFTPRHEIDLCGHATLASAHVILDHLGFAGDRIHFKTMSGPLYVEREGNLLSMDFPAWHPKPVQTPQRLVQALGAKPLEVLATRDLIAVFETADEVVALEPDMRQLAKVDTVCAIVTAPGIDYDFVSRVFVPNMGIPEDPVTGSAHCSLTPYWSKRLGKKKLHAFQASTRGGELFCEDQGKRVSIAGSAVTYLSGVINVTQGGGMPFLRLETNVERNSEHAGILMRELSALAASLLGKPEGFVMISAEFGKHMLFGGTDGPLAFIRLESLGLSDRGCPELAAELCKFLQDRLSIPADRVYIGFGSPDRSMFGWNSRTFG